MSCTTRRFVHADVFTCVTVFAFAIVAGEAFVTRECCLRVSADAVRLNWNRLLAVASARHKVVLAKTIYDAVYSKDRDAALLLASVDVGQGTVADIVASEPARQLKFLHILRWMDSTLNLLHDDELIWSHMLHTARNNLQWMLASYEHFSVVAEGFISVVPAQTDLPDLLPWENCVHTAASVAVKAAMLARTESVYGACHFLPRKPTEPWQEWMEELEKPRTVSNVQGRILLLQKATGGPTTLFVDIRDFNWDDDVTRHGMHVHWHGDVEDDCKHTGGHYNPLSAPHGSPEDEHRHMGDLGNVEEDYYGTARVKLVNNQVSLIGEYSVIGRSIVVHRYEDDFGRGGTARSKATGSVGARIGCCVIEKQWDEYAYAQCIVSSDTGVHQQDIEGVIVFKQSFHGGHTIVSIDLDGFDHTDDQIYHGFHVHSQPDLSNECNGAGEHYNPEIRGHGAPWSANRHVGDLGNIRENSRGEVKQEFSDHKISLFGPHSIIGRSVVIKELEDDLGLGGYSDSMMTGHAGARLGCCVIEEMQEPDPYRISPESQRSPRS